MPMKQKRREDFDKLFEDLGVLELPTGVDVDFKEKKPENKDEDPFAKFLEPKKEK